MKKAVLVLGVLVLAIPAFSYNVTWDGDSSGVITINYSALYEKFKWLVTDKAVELMIQYAEVGLPYACGFLLGVFVPRSILRPPPKRKYVAFRR